MFSSFKHHHNGGVRLKHVYSRRKVMYGIGVDIVKISRIQKVIENKGARFLNRIYTKAEQKAASERGDSSRFYALRWAAKEAGWKALSPGYKRGVSWLDIEISSDQDGKPSILFHGKAAEFFATETGGQGKINLSLSDDSGMALAFVVLSRS